MKLRGRLLDDFVGNFHLTVCPRMADFCGSVLNSKNLTLCVKRVFGRGRSFSGNNL